MGDAVEGLVAEVRTFIHEVVLPEEAAHLPTASEPSEALRIRLQAAARERGLLVPHLSRALGGRGLTHTEQARVFEAAGYSLLGPLALNIAAPDEGNMHMLERIATPEQQEKYLVPLVTARIRSCFAMTEPSPGAGSDPSALRTTAVQDGDEWVVNGHKWYITGADGAAFAVVMARTGGDDDRPEATMFLVDADNPGMTVTRHIPSMDKSMIGGHCEVVFTDCRVPASAVLGEVGAGFANAQVRLAPARLTHCMRWLGLARRSLDLAIDRASERRIFGSVLAELGQVQAMIADSEIDIATSRAIIASATQVLDDGGRGGLESSIAKTYVAEAVYRVVDRSLQVCGSLGVSGDLPLATYLNEVRPFRIYDGSSETHRWSIARRAVRHREAERATLG